MTFEPQASQPSYPGQQASQPSYPGQQASQPTPSPYGAPAGQPAFAPASGQSGTKNPLGLVSALVGAGGFLLGFLFAFVQLGLYATSSSSGLGVLNGVNSVISALCAIAAIVIGFIALSKRGLSRTLAAVGVALGAALALEVLSGLIFTLGLPLIY